jgi:hypothetical protein
LILQAIDSERASLGETVAKLMTTGNAGGVALHRGLSNELPNFLVEGQSSYPSFRR